jgi:hypothetical protein
MSGARHIFCKRFLEQGALARLGCLALIRIHEVFHPKEIAVTKLAPLPQVTDKIGVAEAAGTKGGWRHSCFFKELANLDEEIFSR